MLMKISGPRATVTVPDLKGLRAAWAHLCPGTLVGRFIVQKPLTPAQLRRLPVDLRDRLESMDDSVGFLERLYGLEDPRTAE
jgi:hypothetical protein